MLNEVHALKKIAENVQAKNFEQALSLIDAQVDTLATKVEILSDATNLSMINGSNYLFIATIVFLLASFTADSIAK
jgi:hypothetical protein